MKMQRWNNNKMHVGLILFHRCRTHISTHAHIFILLSIISTDNVQDSKGPISINISYADSKAKPSVEYNNHGSSGIEDS